MTEVRGISVDSWEGLLANPFLKAEHFEGKNAEFVVIETKVHIEDENDKPKLSLTVEREDIKYRFDLNITNAKFIRDTGLEAPSSIVGKVITIKKVNVMNPTTGKEVEGLRICKIE